MRAASAALVLVAAVPLDLLGITHSVLMLPIAITERAGAWGIIQGGSIGLLGLFSMAGAGYVSYRITKGSRPYRLSASSLAAAGPALLITTYSMFHAVV